MAGLFPALADRLMAPSPHLSAPSDPGAALCATAPIRRGHRILRRNNGARMPLQQNRMVHGGDEVSGIASREPCGSGRPAPAPPFEPRPSADTA